MTDQGVGSSDSPPQVSLKLMMSAQSQAKAQISAVQRVQSVFPARVQLQGLRWSKGVGSHWHTGQGCGQRQGKVKQYETWGFNLLKHDLLGSIEAAAGRADGGLRGHVAGSHRAEARDRACGVPPAGSTQPAARSVK